MAEIKKIITKETIQRLLKDVKQIIKHPLTDNGIYYSHDESNMLKGYAMIVGPTDTPYFGGFYFFEFNFPDDYPFSPPTVIFMTNDGLTRYNPNLYKCGKVCVSILNTWTGDKWSSCQTINSILLTLCSLLNDSPLENEPGHTKNSREFVPYQKSIEFSNINFAICDIITLSKNKIPYQFKTGNGKNPEVERSSESRGAR
jgi:ubiquitin-protein ligase